MKLTQTFSGAASLAPMTRPRPGAQPVGLSPAQVGAGPVGPVEGHHLVPGASRIVGHYGLFRRDGLHEVPNDPVGVYGSVVVGQLGMPLFYPGLPLDVYLPLRCPVFAPAVAHDLPAGVDHLPQHQLGVSQYGVLDVVVLVDVPSVVGRLNEGLAAGDVHGHAVLGEARADAEDEVRAAHEMVQRTGHNAGAAAQGQRMHLWKGALAQQGGHDRGFQQLGKLDQFFGSLGVKHSLAGVDDRVLGMAKGPGGGFDVLASPWEATARLGR